MTAIRKSYLIAIEDLDESHGGGFGKGVPMKDQNGNELWYAVPQGFYISLSSSTQATSLYGTGAKIRQNSIYGAFQGSWNASYVMDFNHLEFFSILFDTEDNTTPKENGTQETNKNYANFETGTTGVYEHRFRKLNSKRQRSYVLKELVLDKIAGGKYDKETIYKGFLARNIQIARSTSGSQMAIEMSGVFADKKSRLLSGNNGSFFMQVASPLTQYSCMYMGRNAGPVDADAVPQVDSHSINIETAVSLVYSTCSPIATDFFEDKTTFAWSATAYMNDPTRKFELLPNSGGTLNPNVTGNVMFEDGDRKFSLQPMGKNLAPLEWVNFITYDESMRDNWREAHTTIVDAYDDSEHVVWIQAKNSTVKSTTTPKGDGSKLQDSLSSVECDEIIITVKNNRENIWHEDDLYNADNLDPVNTETVTYRQAAITDVTTEPIDFKIPATGYSGAILGNITIDQSESAITTITLDDPDSEDYVDLTGYVVVEHTDMFNINSQGVEQNPSGYRLDNLVPKQLTDAGEGPSGLTVQTAAIAAVEDDQSTQDVDESVPAHVYPQITGTPEVIRTDYYFIVKKYIPVGETEPVIQTGYLRVAVR